MEQKCSRRSQCQNSTVSTRWVQGGTSLCLSNTSVTPTKFVLERPTNVKLKKKPVSGFQLTLPLLCIQITLKISSGLPPSLAGESFLCLLTTGSGVTISVPYSQVNQTTFTSNITGRCYITTECPKARYVDIGLCAHDDHVIQWSFFSDHLQLCQLYVQYFICYKF